MKVELDLKQSKELGDIPFGKTLLVVYNDTLTAIEARAYLEGPKQFIRKFVGHLHSIESGNYVFSIEGNPSYEKVSRTTEIFFAPLDIEIDSSKLTFGK